MEKAKNYEVINRWIYILLSVIIIALAIWGIYNYNSRKQLNREIENQYQRSFHEMVSYVDGIETQLHKGMLAGSSAQLASISSEIFRQSTQAKACLGQLPTSTIQLDNTAKFLSQVGDYTYVLSQNMINGTNVSDEEYKNLESLTEYAASLNKSLSEIQNGIYDGSLKFSTENSYNTAKAADSDIFSNLENIEKSFEEYPSLIYDGPFSEHIENQQSVMLKDSPEISMEDALKKAQEFLGSKGKNLRFESDTKNSSIDAYSFVSYSDEHEISICVTKRGGYVNYFIDNRTVNGENLNFTDAIKNAERFLNSHGMESLVSSYYDKAGGIATVNFAYIQDGVTCYSDLIKVRVALDNGEILGMEAHGYLMNHKTRDFPEVKISKKEAEEKINPHLGVDSVSLAYIPKDNLEEFLCYEFQGIYNGRNFIVYINAENGREERILMLIESENGILTV